MTDPWIILPQWRVDQLAQMSGLTNDEFCRQLRVLDPDVPQPTGPCECSRIPWQPHQHRYELGNGRLT